MCCDAKKFKESYNLCLRISTAAYKLLEENVQCTLARANTYGDNNCLFSLQPRRLFRIDSQLHNDSNTIVVCGQTRDLDPGSRRVSTQNYSLC